MPLFPSTDKFIPLDLIDDNKKFTYDNQKAGAVFYFSENKANEGTLFLEVLLDYKDYEVSYGGSCIENCLNDKFCVTY